MDNERIWRVMNEEDNTQTSHTRLQPPTLSPSASETGTVQVLSFWLGDQLFGIDVAYVYEVARMVAVTPLPDSPADVLGVVDYRGTVVPIVDMRLRFNLDVHNDDDATPIIIAWSGHHAAGLVVDKVNEVIALEPHTIMAPGDFGQTAPYVSGVARLEDKLLLIVDPAALLSEETVRALNKVDGRP